MNQKAICQYVLAAGISLVFFSCKQKEKNTETSTTDTSATSGTDTTQVSSAPAVMDAVGAAPDQYKVAADSLGLRVLKVNYKPGDSSALHSHPDYVVYAIDGATATFYDKDGAGMESPMKAGQIGIRPAEVHSVKNTGKNAINVLVIEVNRPKSTVTPDAASDATKVAPNLYKLVKDTLGLRAIEVSYKPGQSSPLHSHPDLVLYVTEGSTAEFTDKDGKKMTAEMKKGTILIVGAETHSVKNIGKTAMKAIMVEVNRPRN